MPKFGQAEFAEFLVEMFMKNKLDKILESNEKKNFSSRNTEDIYRKFLSSKDAVKCYTERAVDKHPKIW